VQHRPAALLLAMAVTACGYSVPDEVISGQVVAAAQKPNSDFTQYSTFTVADKIQVFDNTTGVATEYTKDGPQVLARVTQNMLARGYTQVPFTPGVKADLLIGLIAYLGDATYGGYACDWYYWGYYPYSCGYYYYGTYKFGTLAIQMADLKNAPPQVPGAALQVVWGSAIYGILGTQTQPYDVNKLLSSIDRAFAQSPYLHR